MTLAELQAGQVVTVLSVAGPPALAQRLAEFGLFEGETIQFLRAAPLGDPLEFHLNQTRLSLRRTEAALIQVRPHS
ncbi:MAG: FeoA family protein [Gemmataceae bacterium]